jgi:membrane-bound lytic murein transglycosylase B
MMRYLLPIGFLLLATPVLAEGAFDNLQPFSQWIDDFKKDAHEAGVSDRVIDNALADISPDERVVELDRKQPEGTMTLAQYLTRTVTDSRVERGREVMEQHKELLEKIGREYGVQPRFIVALWGIETNFGDNTGNFSTIEALATLAYEGRRADYFRDELIKALKILEAEDMSASDMDGSWAGALGQCQFMPTSFLEYAVDYDKDGKRDIWHDEADVFASIANYLSSSGWDNKEGWGRPVEPAAGFNPALADIKTEKKLSEWKELGIKKIPASDRKASLIFVGEGDAAKPYIIYGNYKVLLKWNRSRYFATAVGTLADKIE